MTECRCPSCSSDPLFTYSLHHRLLCEGRYVLSLPPESRQDYLRQAQRRGRGGEVLEAVKLAQVPF